MCYNATFLTKKKISKAQREGASDADLKELEDQLQELIRINGPLNRVSGFSHPQIPVLSLSDTCHLQIRMQGWGLVPSWTRDISQAKEIANKTLNARVETLFEKPAFRHATEKGRCIVLADSFLEHQHQGRIKVPFEVSLKDPDQIMPLAAISDHWTDPNTGHEVHTVSIVTTVANRIMAKIHNRPGKDGPRMPLILTWNNALEWIKPRPADELLELSAQLAIPFPEDLIDANPLLPVQTQLFE